MIKSLTEQSAPVPRRLLFAGAGSPEVEVRAGQIDKDHRDLGTACTHRLLADAQRLFEQGRRPWVIALLAPDAAENQQGIGHLGMRGAEEGA